MPASWASARVRIGVESTDRRVFASALDWPGWSRSAKTEGTALEALIAYAARYAAISAAVASRLSRAVVLDVVERRPGDATTAFGAPAVVFEADRAAVDEIESAWLAALVEAAWHTLDRVAEGAPAELRKGPRGGGRDRDRVIEHVVGADAAYAREIGVRLRPAIPIERDGVERMRAEMLAVLRLPSDGSPLAGRRWPQRFAARRIAWHALDHAWEIEDRSSPGA